MKFRQNYNKLKSGLEEPVAFNKNDYITKKVDDTTI